MNSELKRTFHHRFTLGAKCGIALFSLLAFYFFWTRAVVVGFVPVLVVVLIVERILHSEYVFLDGKLIVNHGRFVKTREIPLTDIIACRSMRSTFGLVHYLLIEYGAGHMVAVQPENEAAFVRYLNNQLNP